MSYTLDKIVSLSFDEAISRITAELKKEGFGILTDIDVKDTLKKKINVDFRPYRILGACNPTFAHKALQLETKIGTMLPCNITVQQHDDGKVEISAIDPLTSMQAVKNDTLLSVAREVQEKLRRAINSV